MASQLRQFRQAVGLSQAQVAAQLGLKTGQGQAYVSRLEKGLVHRPYLDTIVRYLHVCGVRMSAFADLLDRVEPLPEDTSARRRLDQAWSAHLSTPPEEGKSKVEAAKR